MLTITKSQETVCIDLPQQIYRRRNEQDYFAYYGNGHTARLQAHHLKEMITDLQKLLQEFGEL
jgi:hypothetical protein